MPIKDLYNEVESENSNKVKDTGMCSIPFDEYADEQVDLIKILREGSREELLAKAKELEDELDHCLEERGMTMADLQEPDGDTD